MKYEVQAIISLYKVPFKWHVVSWYVELIQKDEPVEPPYSPELLSVSGISRDEGLLRVITLSLSLSRSRSLDPMVVMGSIFGELPVTTSLK